MKNDAERLAVALALLEEKAEAACDEKPIGAVCGRCWACRVWDLLDECEGTDPMRPL